MRRLVLLSALLVLAGLLLLLPSSPIYSILTTGSTTSGLLSSFGSTDNTPTIESLLGFGLIGVGLVLEIFSMFTDVGAAVPSVNGAMAELTPPDEKTQPDSTPPSSSGFAVSSAPKNEEAKKK